MLLSAAHLETRDAIKARAQAYKTLGKKGSEVFPISYESDVWLTSGPVRGELRGFGHFRSFDDRQIIEVR
jgi:hypothetical protein